MIMWQKYPKPSFQMIMKRNGAIVPFEAEKISDAILKAARSVKQDDEQRAIDLSHQVIHLLNESFHERNIPSVEEIQDHVEQVLIDSGQAAIAKAYIVYRAERARIRKTSREPFLKGDALPYKLLWRVLNWNIEHDVHTIEGINERIRAGEFSQLVLESEDAYEQGLDGAADVILEQKHNIRVIIVAGPSSSGKTTTTQKLSKKLMERAGLEFVPLEVDNYFFNLESHPQDEFGDYDFETPHALDLNLINEHLKQLMAGEEVHIPCYNFKTGQREEETTPLQLKENQILLMDSLHGLYHEMTAAVPNKNKFKLYIETFSQLKDARNHFVRWTDIRLLRRMSRDRLFRAYDPEMTLGHWHYVRKSELQHIIPFLPTVDYVVNGALPYELPVLKSILFKQFPIMLDHFKNQPKRQDALIRGQRVYELLKKVEQVDDFSSIPQTALLREFIG